MYQRRETVRDRKTLGAKDASHDMKNNRELLYFESVIEHNKQIYSKKYQLEPMNIYEKLFNSLNGRIKTEIEQLQGRFDKNSHQSMFKVNNYGMLYRKNSNEVLKLLKNTSANKLKDANEKQSLLKKVKTLDLNKNACQGPGSGCTGEALPKLYDFDENFKFNIRQRRNLKEINNQIMSKSLRFSLKMSK